MGAGARSLSERQRHAHAYLDERDRRRASRARQLSDLLRHLLEVLVDHHHGAITDCRCLHLAALSEAAGERSGNEHIGHPIGWRLIVDTRGVIRRTVIRRGRKRFAR